MIFGHGKMSMLTIDRHMNNNYRDLLLLALKLSPPGRDGPQAGMVPFTGQLYEF